MVGIGPISTVQWGFKTQPQLSGSINIVIYEYIPYVPRTWRLVRAVRAAAAAAAAAVVVCVGCVIRGQRSDII